MAAAFSMAASGKPTFPLYPRMELLPTTGDIDDCLTNPPKWTNMTALDFFPCTSKSVLRCKCFTFDLQLAVSKDAVEPLRKHVSDKAFQQIAHAVELLAVLQKFMRVCDVQNCILHATDCKNHKEMILYIQQVFLFVGRVWLSVEHFLCNRPNIVLPSLHTPVARIVQRIRIAYASWLLHISFYTHAFSAESIVHYLRIGYTWIREGAGDTDDAISAFSPTSAGSSLAASGTAVTTSFYDQPDLLAVLELLLKSRIFELDEVYGRMQTFCHERCSHAFLDGANPRSDSSSASSVLTTAAPKTLALSKDERREVHAYVSHLAHLMEVQRQSVRILEAFLARMQQQTSVAFCLPTWLYAMQVNQANNSVLFNALVLLYTEKEHQNICLAAFQSFSESIMQRIEVLDPVQHPSNLYAPCVFFNPPTEFNLNQLIGNVSVHMKRIEGSLRKQIKGLQELNPAHMPTITHIQVHTCLGMKAASWHEKMQLRDAKITHADSMEVTHFDYRGATAQ